MARAAWGEMPPGGLPHGLLEQGAPVDTIPCCPCAPVDTIPCCPCMHICSGMKELQEKLKAARHRGDVFRSENGRLIVCTPASDALRLYRDVC